VWEIWSRPTGNQRGEGGFCRLKLAVAGSRNGGAGWANLRCGVRWPPVCRQ